MAEPRRVTSWLERGRFAGAGAASTGGATAVAASTAAVDELIPRHHDFLACRHHTVACRRPFVACRHHAAVSLGAVRTDSALFVFQEGPR